MDDFRQAVASNQYGPLQSDFEYTIRTGYTALIGPNNAGKSAILQLAFRTLIGGAHAGIAERLDAIEAVLERAARRAESR